MQGIELFPMCSSSIAQSWLSEIKYRHFPHIVVSFSLSTRLLNKFHCLYAGYATVSQKTNVAIHHSSLFSKNRIIKVDTIIMIAVLSSIPNRIVPLFTCGGTI